MEEEVIESTDESSFDRINYSCSTGCANGSLYIMIGIVGLLFFIGINVGLYVLVACMAQKRNRSVVVWILLSLIATPLLMIIILLAIGKNENYFENHYNRE